MKRCFSVHWFFLPPSRSVPPNLPRPQRRRWTRHPMLCFSRGRNSERKLRRHRFEKLRAGAVKTADGWNVQDFASSFFNPHPEGITVTMKMVSDDPKFLFANGQVGTYTKTYKLRPMQGTTARPAAVWDGRWAFKRRIWSWSSRPRPASRV